MEVYILDSLYRRIDVVDNFESLIWTERCSAYGDFKLTLHSTLQNRNRFSTGTRIAMNESYRVMTIETVEDTTDDEGRALLTLTGRSLEAILEYRVARNVLSDLTTSPKWSITNDPADIARQIFHDICITGVLDPGDVIPGVVESGGLFPEDTIPEPTEEITYEFEPMTVYKAIKDLVDVYSLGFRLVRNFDTSQLHWDIYAGSDRTSSQSTLPAVIFSPNLDNLQNTTELTSIAAYRNVAYVFSPVGHELVYLADIDPDIEGFERRVLLVKADDITDEDAPTASAKMIQRGREELSKNQRFLGFDGELDQTSQYKYGTDYHVGDLVEMRNKDGATNNMQVTEQIFVSDKEGERSYPTLSLNKFITVGSWLSWDFNQVWADLGLTEYWADQP